MHLPLLPLSGLTAQRVLLVALLTPLLLVTVLAAVPALVVLPFLPGGTDRAVRLLRTHTAQLRTLLNASRAGSR
ncbi:dTMP kinase [Kitasatospora sp. NPDC017646]|uniref:dTMP kinase n=1 Tax=Kitasatospora sp. NPDC017646 TaxID=3364024 RepID=UPI00379A2849